MAICKPSPATFCRETTLCHQPRHSWSKSRPQPLTRSRARSSATAIGSPRRFARHDPPPSSCMGWKVPRTPSMSIGNSNKLWHAGCNIIRMNMRNCGGTEALSPTLYHSGLSNDVLAVMNFFVAQHGLQSISLIGYSMGGNLVLKLAGELGAAAPPELRSVIGVSPALDLGPSADALHLPAKPPLRAEVSPRPSTPLPPQSDAVPARLRSESWRLGSVLCASWTTASPALYSGFTGAEDYYYRAAAARVIDRIAVPTLILHALDDPFVRITAESCRKLDANPHISLIRPTMAATAPSSPSLMPTVATMAIGPSTHFCVSSSPTPEAAACLRSYPPVTLR